MKKLFYILCCSLAVLFTACEKGEPSDKSNGDGSSSVSGVSEGHAYIDLGLSVKWATCNVGAVSPEDYGDYFAWGETQPKSYYDWSTYKWCEGSFNTQTKYCTDSYYGIVDNKTILELSDDVANANWGGNWRMPTCREQYELLQECTWTWEQKNGVNGYTVKGPNGNSIFLPAAGNRISSDLDRAGSYGYYWSSYLSPDNSHYALLLDVDLYEVYERHSERFFGHSVRPVLP